MTLGEPGAETTREVEFEAGAGRRRVWGTALLSAGSLSVNLLGGDRPHIGAVAIAIPRPSLSASGRRSASTSVFTVTGHKEDEVARRMADALARRLGVVTVVVAGIHIERAETADIRAVMRNVGAAQRSLAARIARLSLEAGCVIHAGSGKGRRGA
jgi:hypothetical protein